MIGAGDLEGRLSPAYVLVTAAYNEAAFIEDTIRSVVAQTLPPLLWVVVSDGSTDGTDQIVENYARQHGFIRLLRREREPGRSFGSKVLAVRAGIQSIGSLEYAFLGNLDADVTFDRTYFEALLDRFRTNPALGIAGGWIHERQRGRFRPRPENEPTSVPHAVQMLRRECYAAIGEYLVLPYGGEDTHATVSARMRGWETRSYRDLPVLHHRVSATSGGILRNRFRQGVLDQTLGYDVAFECLKCARRALQKPAVVGAVLRLAGFAWGYKLHRRRIVSEDFVRYLRQEQRARILGRSPIGPSEREVLPNEVEVQAKR